MVPHLITALTGPINELEQRMLESLPAIERWFRLEWMEHTPPFYTSVDLRNAGFKLAPVDTNLFPGGFNNLTTEMLPLAVQAAMAAIEKICPEAKNLLLIPGTHTRNSFYLMNVARLMEIFHQAGLNVRLGTLDESIKAADRGRRCPTAARSRVEPLVRTQAPPRPEGLRSLHDPAQQRPVGRHPEDPRGPARAVPAAAAARRLGDPQQDQPLRRLRGGCEEVRQAARHGSLADQPDVRALRRGELLRRLGRRVPDEQRRDAARQDPPQVQGIRHPGEALHHRQGRRRHLRHGHHDGARPEGPRRPEPAHAQQDERDQGRPGGERGHPPGRRADLRARSTTRSPSRWST